MMGIVWCFELLLGFAGLEKERGVELLGWLWSQG